MTQHHKKSGRRKPVYPPPRLRFFTQLPISLGEVRSMADSVCALDSVGALRSVPSAVLFLFFSFFFFYARYLHKFDFPLPQFLSFFFPAEFHRYLSAGQSSCSKRRKAMMHFRFLRVPKESMELT
jgi:hypothetical protein